MKIEITSLRVVGCGPLQDVRIDFTDKETGKPLPVVLLAGANGSGKTTVLEVMFGLAQLLEADNKQMPYRALWGASSAVMDCLVDGSPFSFHYGQLSQGDTQTSESENIGYSIKADGNSIPPTAFFHLFHLN